MSKKSSSFSNNKKGKTFYNTPMIYRHTFKRLLDLVVATILAVVFLPVWIIVPILIKLTSEGPVFFLHKRVGKDGKEFMMFKFRTMVNNADEILYQKRPELLKKFKENDWKLEMKDDPRITSIGRVLRALTIDEFPQIINVFKGEMSMIGPRAYIRKELDEQLKKYPQAKKYIKIILTAKPGITGVWQTSGRNEISFDKRTKLDAKYVQEMSLWNDLKILLKTPKAMISKW